LTGGAHSGAELHGFLSYLVKCALLGRPYTIHGYKGKQVRDNLHATDLVNAFWCFAQEPRCNAVYNIGGSRHSNCSVLEAIRVVEEVCGRRVNYNLSANARMGDHIWWISDVRKFQRDYPAWTIKYDLRRIVEDILETTDQRLSIACSAV
jgi:CDP-paratose 2-epimerase